MTDLVRSLPPRLLAPLGTCFTWGMTARGAAVVSTRRNLSRKVPDMMPGFAVMMVLDVAIDQV
jgi:zinc transporter, ZIP family